MSFRLSRLVRRILLAATYVAAGALAVLVIGFVAYLDSRPDLAVWHLADLDEELTAASAVADLRGLPGARGAPVRPTRRAGLREDSCGRAAPHQPLQSEQPFRSCPLVAELEPQLRAPGGEAEGRRPAAARHVRLPVQPAQPGTAPECRGRPGGGAPIAGARDRAVRAGRDHLAGHGRGRASGHAPPRRARDGVSLW